jgi:hypothetical protein
MRKYSFSHEDIEYEVRATEENDKLVVEVFRDGKTLRQRYVIPKETAREMAKSVDPIGVLIEWAEDDIVTGRASERAQALAPFKKLKD